MYETIRHGGRLDSEFFPESIAIQSWPSAADYSKFLVQRHVDDVMLWHSYTRRWRTNEHALLEQLTKTTADQCAHGLVRTRHEVAAGRYDVYSVDRSCASHA
jgi:hypothetical protein